MSDGTRAVVHDLGYKRYLGTRRPQRTRWRVVVGNTLRMAWQGWWRLKLWVIGAFIATVSFGTVLYVSQNEIFSRMIGKSGQVTFADALVPFTFTPPFFPFLAFVVTMTVAASAIARDLGAGAFEFYFSRPVRPVDYIAGKLGGLFVIMWILVGAGPLALALFRLGLSSDTEALLSTLGLVGKVAFVGTLSAFAFAAVSLGFSALSTNRKHTLALWAGYYFIFGSIFAGLARHLDIPVLAVLDLKNAIGGLALGIFDLHLQRGIDPGLPASIGGIVGLSAAGLALAYWRVARAERAGLGGG